MSERGTGGCSGGGGGGSIALRARHVHAALTVPCAAYSKARAPWVVLLCEFFGRQGGRAALAPKGGAQQERGGSVLKCLSLLMPGLW